LGRLAGREGADAFDGDVGGEDEEGDSDESEGQTFFALIGDAVAQSRGKPQGDKDPRQ
jgi:hypothetical protein